MSEQEKNEELGVEYKKRIEQLKEMITESLGISNVKIDQLEKELKDFQKELYETNQVLTTEHPTELDKLIRLYKAERSLTDILQEKIIDLEKELTELKVDYKGYKNTETLLNEFKGFFSNELAKLTLSTPLTDSSAKIQINSEQTPTSATEPIEGLLSTENKFNKEERLRLQSENQELQKELHYHQERYDNLKKELQFRTQEVQSLKRILQEQEQEETEEYLTKDSINDEYGFTLEEEFDLTKEELNTLKGKYLTLENENNETEKVIDSYKKELTDLKKVLEKKNKEIKDIKRLLPESSNDKIIEESEINDDLEIAPSAESIMVQELQRQLEKMNVKNEELQKELHTAESETRELKNSIKKLEEKKPDNDLLPLQQELDKKSKILWKMEKTMNIFDSSITASTETFDRHVEVYSLLLNKIYNARGYALILDTLLRHKGTMLTKKMVLTEAKTEPHITIRVLRELHDSKVIHFDEQLDQIVWR